VHTDGRNRGDAGWTVEKIHMNHGVATMGFAFRAGVHAGLATNATRLIDVEFVTKHQGLPCFRICRMTCLPMQARALLSATGKPKP
jgi:hypothetical protein